ncbi:MAG: valine--tRNA ligase [Planctomycetota bacterium]
MSEAPPTSRPASPPGELPKSYTPADHEARIRARWDEAGAFHADPQAVLRGSKKPYTVLIPPPNVTAALHLGHALNNTIQDILVRAHRMMGYESLWMPGTDHAGIATQTVVDKRLKAEGKPALAEHKKMEAAGEPGRERFIKQVQAWKDEYEARITDQLKAMGCSCDWNRQRFTMDEVCAKAVREAFFRLFKDGLIYRGKRLVNWDPVTQTALADDEVEMEEVQEIFAYMRYPLVGEDGTTTITWADLSDRGYPDAGDQPQADRAFITVATTRPETYLGDVAVAINPTDPRAESLKGLRCKLPLVGRIIPIIEDDYVVLPDPESSDGKAKMATGFLKVTPAHDPNDYDLGHRHAEDITFRCSAGEVVINVMAPDASISKDHGWNDFDRQEGAAVFLGLSREDAREKVLELFKERTVGSVPLLEKVVPHPHSVGHSYRSHAAIEPYMSDQWYVRVTDDRLRGAALSAMVPDQRVTETHKASGATEHGNGSLRFYPDRYARTFETWHENLRDWCISRQLWWGHRIPVWSRTYLDNEMMLGAADAYAGLGFATQRDHLTHTLHVCPPTDQHDLENQGFDRDPDVLDTWFSSALWPLSTLGWPTPGGDTEGLLDAFNPTSVLTTAREIITLWVSRMVMFNRYFLGAEAKGHVPFDDVFIHAMIQDGEGRKMSKSLGNGVDPLDIIHTHGADAMRFTLCQMTTNTQDVRMPVERDEATGRNTSPKFDIGRNFSNKLWNASRFVMGMLDTDDQTTGGLGIADRWMLGRLAHATAECERALNGYSFSAYAETIYDLVWREFCDWYLEAIKPTVGTNAAQRACLRNVLDGILRLLHPVMPFVTEVIYEHLRAVPADATEGLLLEDASDGGLLCTASWPDASAWRLSDATSMQGLEFERVQQLVTAIREVRAQHRVPPKRKIVLHPSPLAAEVVALGDGTVETLAGLREVTDDAPRAAGVTFRYKDTELSLSDLADAVDADAERERLTRQVAEAEKSVKALEGRLNNPGYVNKAPEHLVNQTKQQLASAQADLDAAQAALGALG